MTDWREELIEKMALQISRAQFGDWVINPTEKTREQARAALAVAEPVIREQCARMADAIAKDYRVYRDHYPHSEPYTSEQIAAEGAEQVATAIREKRNFATEGGQGMRDILERLQGPRTPQGGSWPYPNLHDEASDEITRLREELADCKNAAASEAERANELNAENIALCEENARLRELLKPFEEAAGKLDDEPVGVGRQIGFTIKDCRAIRTAIREKRSFATEGGKQ